jgi:hypothetical protein
MAKGKTFKGFSDEQMKRIAGKLGFQGPVENFGQFLQSNPAMAAKYAGLEAKARMKFQVGGLVPQQRQPGDIQAVSFGMPQPSPISEMVSTNFPLPPPLTGTSRPSEGTFSLDERNNLSSSMQRPSIGDDFIVPRGGFPWGDDIGKLPDRGDDIGKLPDINNFVNAMSDEERRNWAQNRSIQRDVKSPEEQALINSVLRGEYRPAQPPSTGVGPPTTQQYIPQQQPYGPLIDPNTGEPIREEIMRPAESDFERFGIDTSAFDTYANKLKGQKSTGGTLSYDASNPNQGIFGSPAAMTGTNADTVRAMLRIFDQYTSKSGNTNISPKIDVTYGANSNEFDLKVDGKSVGKFNNTQQGMSNAGQALIRQFNNQFGGLEENEMIGTGEYNYAMPTVGDISGQRIYEPGLPEGGTQLAQQIEINERQKVAEGTGQVTGDRTAGTSQVTTAAQATASMMPPTSTYDATQVSGQVGETQAATGQVSQGAQVQAAQGEITSPAEAAQFDMSYAERVQAGERDVSASEMVTAATSYNKVESDAAQANAPVGIVGEQTSVKQQEIANAAQIAESKMAQATAAVAAGLDPAAIARAEQLDQFSVDAGTLAAFKEGNVEAQATVEGQLEKLMKQFDDGTPAWAAGAMRAANSAMAARGLGKSSMAGAAILQAAMESALPIASQDAQTFAQMGLQNLAQRTQVSLANAAAAQGVELANLNARQQTAIQNSSNAFALQSQNLSNMQQTVISNAQIRAGLQGQNLSNQQQAVLANAARYAEVNNLNLNSRQQAALQNSANSVQVSLANLSNRQQTALANAQIQAAMEGRVLDNKQQSAVINAERFAEANTLTFNAAQQAQLANSQMMQTIGLQDLNARQAAVLQNAATLAQMDMTNLSNRQQAAVQNAQAFLQMDMTNLSNEQQAVMFDSQSRLQALFSDQAADNAAKNFNASSQNQTDQFFAQLATTVSQFNATQTNALTMFNAEEANDIAQFNAQIGNERDQFNAGNELLIAQSFAQWNRDVATANTAAVNVANQNNAQAILGISEQAYANMFNLYADSMEYAWTSGENERDRINNIALARLRGEIEMSLADFVAEGEALSDIGGFLATAALGYGQSKGFFDLGGIL